MSETVIFAGAKESTRVQADRRASDSEKEAKAGDELLREQLGFREQLRIPSLIRSAERGKPSFAMMMFARGRSR